MDEKQLRTTAQPSILEYRLPPPPDPAVERRRQQKALQIGAACLDNDIAKLITLSTEEYGLVNDELRRKAWPLLLGCRAHGPPDSMTPLDTLPPRHRDTEEQVHKDVDRAFVYYPNNESRRPIERRREELQDIILRTLRQLPFLEYFQGFHDIAQVFLLVLGREAANEAVARVALLRIRDHMFPDMKPSVVHLRILPSLLRVADFEIADRLSHSELLSTSYFALHATLTLYAHEIEEYGDIARLYDFLLSQEAVAPIYLFAVTVIVRRKELLSLDDDEPELLYATLSRLPQPLNLEKLISETLALLKQHPPETLPAFRWPFVSSSSVLKTTRDPQALAGQSLEDGKQFFMRQLWELETFNSLSRVRQKIWSNRGLVGGTLAVLLLSYWMRKEPGSSILNYLWQRARQWI